MTAETDTTIDSLLDRFCGEEDEPTPQLEAFARSYLRRIPPEYLDELSPERVCAQVRDFFGFVAARREDEMAVRVFTPTVEDHGYTLPGSVVEVASPDMAFLVDSVTNELTGNGYSVERVFHPVVGTVRDTEGNLVEILPARGAPTRESVQHIELGRKLQPEQQEAVEAGVRRVLRDVRRAVSDFEPMQGAIYRMIKIARSGVARYEQAEVDETVAFLEWLLDDNFVFLGYREYSIDDGPDGRVLSVVPNSGLGILTADADSRFASPTPLSELPEHQRQRWESGELVVVTKTNSMSRVHRRSKMDYVGVRHIGHDGAVIGEARLIGLLTSKAYMAPADAIPILRRRLGQILEAEDTMTGSHLYKEIVEIFNSFPKDELFATPTEDIRSSIVGLIQNREREQVKLFARRDLLQRNVSLLVVVPRDRFDAELRMRLQEHFKARFGGESIDYRLSLGETGTARIHFTVWMGGRDVPDISYESLEAEVLALCRTWDEQVEETLVRSEGPDRGVDLARTWAQWLPDYYKSPENLDIAVGDIVHLDQAANNEGAAVVGLQEGMSNGERLTRLAVYQQGGRLELSDIMPTLEHFGIRVIEEVPTRISTPDDIFFIHDFGVLGRDDQPLDIGACGHRVTDTIQAVLAGNAESDSLSRLIISAGLDYHQVNVLRAYRTYWQRVGSGFTTDYINDAFAAHPQIAAGLVQLFEARFDPDHDDWERESALINDLSDALDAVASLDEDRILRGFLALILATVRTNAYQERSSLSFKFDSPRVPNMPPPAPFMEIFVFAPSVEGVHLRGGAVARGGIRWSVRREDYRTEVLGLMKAQMTKNAVIVPTGSKGGFVLRHPGADGPTPDQIRNGYITFIRGLLDITDNLVDGEVVHPARVRIHDGPDPYLVVAADRGTATFSDTANELAAEYGFWLGDAFASGGSAGYDHKVLGITARGAWESVKWHFQEIGKNPAQDVFTVVGIGDMSGDVFGNGLLMSRTAKLVAAFDHRHIFIDPDPDPAASYQERKRLFALARSSWDDYDKDKISEGGGVWPRSAKQVELSEQARAALGIEAHELTPAEVIQAILRAPVDLLWNGGIGSYVKASFEDHDRAGDRSNDAVRVNADELRCKIVAEGGNLGFTQRGRIEYALNGGLINTDFIDNSGGVNCSDREVNLKILLGLAELRGELEREGRDRLVESVADDVVERILYDNFLQAQILSQEAESSPGRLEEYEDLMVTLETTGKLRRKLEQLPTTEDMVERGRTNAGLTQPELSVLLAYSKWSLRDWLMKTDLPGSDDFGDDLTEYFPGSVVQQFGHLIPNHPLRRELVAMLVANEVVNSAGITFVSRLMNETGATADRVARAYQIARAVTGAEPQWSAIEQLMGTVNADLGRDLLGEIDQLVESVARWQLTHPTQASMRDVIASTEPGFRELTSIIGEITPEPRRAMRAAERDQLVAMDVPHDIAIRHTYQRDLAHACDIIDVANTTGWSIRDVATIFMLAGPSFELDWLEGQVAHLPAASRWHRQAIRAVEDDLLLLRRQLAESIIAEAGDRDPEAALDHYLVSRTTGVARLVKFAQALAVDGVDDVASVVVAIRQIRGLTR